MTQYERITGKLFGETATATGSDPEIGQFGSALAGTYNGTTDISTIQGLSAWSKGWINAVTADTNFPPLPEMTGVHKVLSYQNNYLLQSGIPEWDSGTDYYTNNFCRVGNKIYYSLTDNNQNNDPSSDTTNWHVFKSGGNAGVPIGTIFSVLSTQNYTPTGAVPCDGTEYQSSMFQVLWDDYLTAETPLIQTCTYTEYATEVETYGSCLKFAINTETNTFKVPTFANGTFIQQAQTVDENLKQYTAGLPNVSGYVTAPVNATSSTTSPIYHSNKSGDYFDRGDSGGWSQAGRININLSRANSIYGNSDTVQPKSVAIRFFVQIANGEENEVNMDWSKWQTSLQGKANISQTYGDWVSVEEGVNLSTSTAIATYNLDLSSYLPSDNYNYEVMLGVYGSNSNSTGANLGFTSSLILTTSYVLHTSSNDYATRCLITFPVGVDRQLNYIISAHALNSGYVALYAYRRMPSV